MRRKPKRFSFAQIKTGKIRQPKCIHGGLRDPLEIKSGVRESLERRALGVGQTAGDAIFSRHTVDSPVMLICPTMKPLELVRAQIVKRKTNCKKTAESRDILIVLGSRSADGSPALQQSKN